MKGPWMTRTATAIITSMFAAWLAGCHSSVTPTGTPLVFAHDDEMMTTTVDAGEYRSLADRRVFAVMTFLNAAGYDDEVSGRAMHPVRTRVRQRIAANLADHPDKLAAWRNYYDRRRLGAWQYVNWSLCLTADYPFRRTAAARNLTYPWTRWMLDDLPDILNDFWVTADLTSVWSECLPDYLAEMRRYDPNAVARDVHSLWRYVRMPRRDDSIIVSIPNLLERHATANGNRFPPYFYSVDGPGSGGLVHEYCHTFVNDLVKANYSAHKKKLKSYFDAGKDAAISASYQDPTYWVAECTVHAICHRLTATQISDAEVRRRIDANADALTRGGYTLLKPLCAGLVDFEADGRPFDQYLPILFKKLPEYTQ